MPLHSFHSKAVRLNGYTDGLVVPTGAYRETGVDLFAAEHPEKTGAANSVSSYESNETKIGRYHIPQEGNPLNHMVGAFTLEAFIIPDMGGVVLHKPNCYTLKVGEVRQKGYASFDVHTLDPSGEVASQRVMSSIQFPLNNPSHTGTYTGGEYLPDDLSLPSRELLYVNAQFTGKRMMIYINTDLVADMDFGGEERIVRSFSSDVFIGGMGGEFRGVIESVRISRGTVAPILRPFTATPDTAGLWNFEDEVDIPDLHFFNNKNPSHPNSGVDGAGNNEGLFEQPMVCLGYDFHNYDNPSGATAPNTHPIGANAGNQFGYFRIRDFDVAGTSGYSGASALEKLAAYILKIPVDDLKLQPWYATGILDFTRSTSWHSVANYGTNLAVSPLNAIVNASGTSPTTGTRRTPFTRFETSETGGLNLDPMMNPIERMRIIAIDLKGRAFTTGVVGEFDPAHSAYEVVNGLMNRPPGIVVQSILTKTDISNASNSNEPFTQGFLFDHADDTPIWFTLGNGDLVIDDGAEASGSKQHRARGQMTRARNTQGQRFSDISGANNDAYWFAPKSRMQSNMFVAATPDSDVHPEMPPQAEKLALWLDSNDRTTLLRDDGSPVTHDGEYVWWWKNKAPSTITLAAATHNYAFFAWGDGWKYKEICSNARGRSGLEATEPSLHQPVGPINAPGGNPALGSTTVTPDYPVSQYFWGGSGWVNGFGAPSAPSDKTRVADVGTVNPQPLFSLAGHQTTMAGASHSDGDWSMYFLMTAKYDSTNKISLINSEAYDAFNITINNGGANCTFTTAGIGSPVNTATQSKPTANTPSMTSIRIDESESKVFWKKYDGTLFDDRTYTGWSSTNPLRIGDASTSVDKNKGIELLCKMASSSGTTNSLTELAPPGFIIHEVVMYNRLLTDSEDADVRQYFENKYGVDA